MYDGNIGRWLTTDPRRQFASSYEGMGNNPVSGVDTTGGFDWYIPNGSTDYTQAVWHDGSAQIDGLTDIGSYGTSVDPATGRIVQYFDDGTKTMAPAGLQEVEIQASRKVNYDRLPDYYAVNVSAGGLLGVTETVTYDRYGVIRYSVPGLTIGKSLTAVSGSVSANWMLQRQKPSEKQLNAFLTGNGFSASAGWWVGGNYSTNDPFTNGPTSAGIGVYSPQIGVGWNYTPQTWNTQTNLKW